VLAVWSYALARVDSAVDAVIHAFYTGPIGPYWPPERQLVESGYRELVFPWPEFAAPAFSMHLDWTLTLLEGYLGTWSAVRRCMAATGIDPVAAWHDRFLKSWGAGPERARRVEWPINLRVFRLPQAQPW
jgi:hypothetical protein